MIEANGNGGVIVPLTPALHHLTDEELGKVVRAYLMSEGSITNPFDGKPERVLAIAYDEIWQTADEIKMDLNI